MTDNQEDTRRKRLRYQSWHRGCKETDLILGGYCDAHLATLDDATLDIFEALLEEDDADIWAWIVEKQPIPKQEYTPIIEKLRHFREYSPVAV